MAVCQNLYQVFKLPASFIVANNCQIENYTISRGEKEENIVSIGDNLIFQQIRYYYGNYQEHNKLFNKISQLRSTMHIYKKQGKYKEAHILDRAITEKLFVKDIINVYLDGKKSDFHKFRVNGFNVNGIHYVYLCSGSGQIRRNTATFVNEELYDFLVKRLNCGLDEKTSQFVLAKYSAYFALAFSSILWVRTPRVCVIKDFYRTLPNEKVDFICKDENGKSYIDPRIMDLELNCADGQGLIDPYFAELWAQDMNLSYTPCSFVARSCFIKGNLATFDFKEYAHKHNIFTIRDRWGVEYNINDIDVLLSESQFKTYKYYNSWQEYCEYAKQGEIHWGVARYNKRQDEEYVLANYQYIQSLELSKEDIKQLIQPTVNWIQQICSGELLPTLLYSFGVKDNDVDYDSMYSIAQTSAMKAVVKNVDFLQDSYVQYKIYKNIAESINHAKLGKIWIKGNYQFMVSDPVAQCQAALGLDPVGIVPKDTIWSSFWNKRNADIVDLCRSPMIDVHEHNPSKVLLHNDEADYWLRYLNSGIVFSTYDTAVFRAEDADFDGDIVLSTDNEYFIKGSHKDHSIITYEKGLAVPAKMTVNNITKTVMKGFGTGVGGFSNTATILYAMAAIFNKPGHEDQYNIIMTRIKLLREIVGQEIDRIKGADKPFLPSEWKKFEKIDPEDDAETRLKKIKNNAIVVAKKPYFFRYLYPELNQKFKRFEDSYNQISRDMFGIKFKKLLKKENQTEEEKMLIRRYQKYSPLITSDCTMNRLCREFESIDFDIKFAKDVQTGNKKYKISKLPTYEKDYENSFDEIKLAKVKKMYSSYTSKKQIKRLTALYNKDTFDDDYIELRSNIYDAIIKELQIQLLDTGLSYEEFLFYCHKLSQTLSNFNWGFAWEIIGEKIVELIPPGPTFAPVKDNEEGTYEYLGNKYYLKDVSDTTSIAVDRLIEAMFNWSNYNNVEDDDLNIEEDDDEGGE